MENRGALLLMPFVILDFSYNGKHWGNASYLKRQTQIRHQRGDFVFVQTTPNFSG